MVDFNTSNDVIVLTELFANVGYKGTDPFIDRYLRLVQSGANTQVQIDPNGTAGAPGFSTLVTLNNVVSTSLNANNFVF
ncbi:type I secretion C-terminal target domain-containing protein [Argonema antarcticum]|uniref:type I secretion C-terminal target domain-containing protein n=1 Tax=Argonema antarcticum TaxID=2942763 RepID=UPI003083FC72|nr:type I secretion C-terminal target domain-containing protein [Argonema antarcticum A004/B2]